MRAPLSWGQLLALLLVLVTIVYLAIAYWSPGYVSDIGTNKTWGRWITRNGIWDAYRIPTDYPPVLLYGFGLGGWIYQALVDPSFNERAALASPAYTLLVKLPALIAHVVLAVVIYRLARRYSASVAFMGAALYALNPAVAYDVAHLGQTDPVHSLFVMLSLASLVSGASVWAGAWVALAALTKPQAWILLPLVGIALIAWHGLRGAMRGTLGGVLASLLVLSPWIAFDRVHHLPRFFEYLETKSVNSTALTAQAHNVWWVPTLLEWRFINDWETVAGPISYRALGLAMVAILVAVACWRLRDLRPRDRVYELVAVLAVAWFCVTVRAHENHLFMAAPLLTLTWSLERRGLVVLAMVSTGLLLNVALHDPLLMGSFAAGPDPGQPLPAWVIVAQVGNVLLNLTTLGVALAAWLGAGRWQAEAAR
ncbi:MAG: glycosyltransferase 87 family protein [Chloroflexota bacterium]